MMHTRKLAILALAWTVFFWGTSFTATKAAYAELPPMAVIWLRMLIATAVFLPFWSRLPRPQRRRGDGLAVAASMAFIPCAYFTLEGYAMVFTSSSQAGVVSATAPLIVAVGAWIFLRERLRWQQVSAIIVSMAMVTVLALAGTVQSSAPAPWLGNLLELGAMATAAGSTITIKHLSSRYHPWLLAGLQAATGAVFFAPLALAGPAISWASLSAQTWIAVAYLGVFPGLVAFGLYNTALRALPAATASMAINAIPAVAVIAGWLILGEGLTGVQIAACAAIIAAVGFAQWSSGTNVEPGEPLVSRAVDSVDTP